MKLPNAERAYVDIAKLRDYCLNPAHPRGRHKAYVFARTLGLTAADAQTLRRMLLSAVLEADAVPGREDEFGKRYAVDFEVDSGGRIVVVRSAWIVLAGEDFPRFTTCYVMEEGANQ